MLARGPQFGEDLLVVDLDLAESTVNPAHPPEGVVHVTLSDQPIAPYAAEPAPHAPRLDPVGEVYEALILGLRDYVRKNGFRSVLLGLSGGIDSTLVATIAADALGGENVVGISIPSRYSSQHSRDDAEELATRLGLDYRVIPIEPMVSAFLDNVKLSGVAEENLQARVRGAGADGPEQPGGPPGPGQQQQERAVGRLLDHLRRQRRRVRPDQGRAQDPGLGAGPVAQRRGACAAARRRRSRRAPSPRRPSAELRPGQVDQDSLPPYDVLDAILDAYVEGAQGRAELRRGRLRRRRSSTRSSAWSTGPSGSAASSPPDRRSPAWRSAATGGCRSPAGGASRTPEPGPVRLHVACPPGAVTTVTEQPAPYGTGTATPPPSPLRRVRIPHLQAMKERGERWAMLTAYDQYAAEIFDEAGIPVLLVGDSAGNNVLGYETTVPVTVDELLPLVRAVTRAARHSLVVADLPFGSYQGSPEQALATATRLHEGGRWRTRSSSRAAGAWRRAVELLTRAGIPVMAHIGFTPQSEHTLGGYRVQGRGDAAATLVDDARALRGGRRVRRRPGDGARAGGAGRSPRSCASPRSASAPARTATPRCWSGRTWPACAAARRRGSSSGTPTCARPCTDAARAYADDVAAARSPAAEHSFES